MSIRKGTLLGVRDDIRVMDVTIRDGKLYNNFGVRHRKLIGREI